MAELDDLILHDLKNPLSGITGTIGLFLDGMLGELSAEQRKYLSLIDVSAREMAGMIHDLSAVNNMESGKYEGQKESFAASEILSDIEWIIKYAERDEKELLVDSPDKVIISTDKKTLTRVIENLLLNALKQAPEKGQISFKIYKEKRKAYFEIIDSQGRVVPKEYFAKVFDRSFRTRFPQFRSKVSPGLGFYYCGRAIQTLGGEIEMATAGARGYRIIFSLACL